MGLFDSCYNISSYSWLEGLENVYKRKSIIISMVNNRRRIVTMGVDPDFFDNLFEPARKKVQKQLGLDRLTQRDFTKMISKSKMNFDIPLKFVRGANEFTKIRKRKKR